MILISIYNLLISNKVLIQKLTCKQKIFSSKYTYFTYVKFMQFILPAIPPIFIKSALFE